MASADNDDSYPPAMAERLQKALAEAGVNHSAEIYAGSVHGWMVPDFPSYDPASATRGWKAMLGLFDRTLHK